MKINNKTELTTNLDSGGYDEPELAVDNHSFQPADKLPDGTIAADLVAGWACNPSRSLHERLTAYRFLSLWPDGPQLKPGTKGRPSLYNEPTVSISIRIPKKIFDNIPTPRSKWVRNLILKNAPIPKKVPDFMCTNEEGKTYVIQAKNLTGSKDKKSKRHSPGGFKT